MSVKTYATSLIPRSRLNQSLRILIWANTILVFAMGLFAPFYAVFVAELGGSIAFAGFSWGLFSILTGIFTFIFASWGLRVKEQELLVSLGYLLRGAVFMSYAFMTSIPQLIITQIFWGFAAALGNPAFDALYTKHTEQENSFMEWGRWEGISSIAVGCAALIGGVLIESFGYQMIFILMAGICVLLGLHIWKLPREVL